MIIKNNKKCNITINDKKISSKSAKELFEELGYELICQNKNDIRYLAKDTYTDEGIEVNEEKQIIFCINDGIGIFPNNSIIMECSKKYGVLNELIKTNTTTEFIITMQELQAINKQVDELNWNEEVE